MDIRAICRGLATAASTVERLQCLPSLPDAIDPPTFAPIELSGNWDQTFHGGGAGLSVVVITCGVYASRGDTDEGRELLVDYLAASGPGSIRAAIETDRTLGGVAKALHVEEFRGVWRLYNIGGVDYLGGKFDVRVWA